MSTSKPTIVITAVIIEPQADDDHYDPTKGVANALQKAIPEAIKDVPGAQFNDTYSILVLDPEQFNCFQCEHCQEWTTNYEKPDTVRGISVGRLFEGMLVCDQCECRKYDPEYGWATKGD